MGTARDLEIIGTRWAAQRSAWGEGEDSFDGTSHFSSGEGEEVVKVMVVVV